MSLRTFEYVVIERSGGKRRGVVRAEGRSEAYRSVSSGGGTVLRIREARAAGASRLKRGVGKTEIASLTRELHVLVQAKIPIAQGLVSIAEHEANPAMRSMLLDLASRIEAGASITEAMDAYRPVFGEVYVETMRAAQVSGCLGSVTAHLAEMLDRQIEASQQMRRAMTYPAIVVAAVALALGVIFTFVVPKFERMFASTGVELPLATRIVQAMGRFCSTHGWILLVALGAAAWGLRRFGATPRGRRVFERTFLRVPHLRQVLVSNGAARFARVLGIGVGAGLSLIDALVLSGRASGRVLLRQECEHMADMLRQGERLADALRTSRQLPSFARRMLGAGRDAADVVESCRIVADHYDREGSHLTKNVSSAIEPVLTILLAAVVLVVALAVFLPMWQMVRINK